MEAPATKKKNILYFVIGFITYSGILFSIFLPLVTKEPEEIYQDISYLRGILEKGYYNVVHQWDGKPAILDEFLHLGKDVKLIIDDDIKLDGILPRTFANINETHQFIDVNGGELSWKGEFNLVYRNLTHIKTKKYHGTRITLANLDPDQKNIIDPVIKANPSFQDYCGHCINFDIRNDVNETYELTTFKNPYCEKKYFTFLPQTDEKNYVTLVNGYCALEYLQDVKVYKLNHIGNLNPIIFDVETDVDKKNLIIHSDMFNSRMYEESSYVIHYLGEPIYHYENDIYTFKFGSSLDIFQSEITIKDASGNIIDGEKHVVQNNGLESWYFQISVQLNDKILDNQEGITFQLKSNGLTINHSVEEYNLLAHVNNIPYEENIHLEILCWDGDFECGYMEKNIVFLKGFIIDVGFNIDNFNSWIHIEHNLNQVLDETLTTFNPPGDWKEVTLQTFTTISNPNIHTFQSLLPKIRSNIYTLNVYHEDILKGKQLLDMQDYFEYHKPSIDSPLIDVLDSDDTILVRCIISIYTKDGLEIVVWIDDTPHPFNMSTGEIIYIDIDKSFTDLDIVIEDINKDDEDKTIYKYP